MVCYATPLILMARNVMMTESRLSPQRLCLRCHNSETISEGELVWPPAWKCPACGASPPAPDGIPLYAPELADTTAGFDPASFSSLATFEETHFWFVARNRLIAKLLRRHFPHARSFLEIGCGNGIVLRDVSRIAKWNHLVGADLHPKGLHLARTRLGSDAEYVQIDATCIPATNAFDVIGAFDVLEHIKDDEAVLREMHRALTPQGGVLIAVPQHPFLWSISDDIAYHQRRYARGEIERKLAAAGFQVLFSSSYVVFLLPLLVLNRLIGYRNSDTVDAKVVIEREFNISPNLNRFLLTILRVEVALTAGGVRWPWGGSRIVVARRIN
jgi:ubiquinone/menaquinone biosynthesis C-methylase UbiE